MMEEVSDDTNGESSFEFISGKIDENSAKDDTTSLASAEKTVAPSSSSSGDASKYFPLSGNLTGPFPVTTPKLESNVTFYDPRASSQSVMLPPLITPAASSATTSSVAPSVQSHYPPVSAPVQSHYPPVTAPVQSQYPPVTSPVQSQYPPVTPPVQSHYPPVQQGYSPVNVPPQALQTPPTHQPYFSVPTQHSALNLPVEGASAVPQQSDSGVWGWIKGNDFLNKVAEKAKNSVDSVITTLDPGMKEIINTGGDINVVVASGNEDKISAVREAFQMVFGKAVVQGVSVQSSSIAPQPVGFSAGLKAAEERISNLKQLGFSQDRQILISIENFLAEFTPDNWFDLGCLLLQDQSSGINLQVYTTAIPVSSQHVNLAKDQTPPDYPLGWSGYAVTIGQIMGPALGVPHSQWHQALTGVSRREILLLAAKTIAGLYKSRLER